MSTSLPKTSVQKITQAMNFAARQHSSQRRKGADAEPYVNHVIEVADLLAKHGADEDTIIAGILHDTIEDTGATREQLARLFGENVADIVCECSDDKSLPKAERKRLQAENAPHKSAGAKMVKMGDKISNLRTILTSPPADWSEERKLEYFEWSKKVVDGCRGINPGLETEYDQVYATGIRKFGRAS